MTTTTSSTITVKSAVSKEDPDSTGRTLQAAAATEAAAAEPATSTKSSEALPASSTGKIAAGVNHGGQNTAGSSAIKKKGKRGDRYLFTESPVEYYYYHQPVVKKVYPKQGLTSGGTPIEVSGAWFDLRLDYGVIPYCAIGDKIVRAQFISTVRIVCYSPPNDNLSLPLPVKVSLNGVDFVDTGFFFSYYTQPELTGLSPASGPYQGGTEVMLKGNLFANI